MAVSTRACGNGSLIGDGSSGSTMGARPGEPDAMIRIRLTPLPINRVPTITRVRLRSSSRMTPHAKVNATAMTSPRFTVIG